MRSFFLFFFGFGHALNYFLVGVVQLLAQRSAQKSERLYSTMVVGLRQPSTANMANHYFAKQSQHLE